jgi:geranylgeranyl reductase family protein
MEEKEYDVVIIGGGPSVSICAISLKKLNPSLRVCIIDRKKFPRDKACGDGLGPGVHKIVIELGLNHLFSSQEPIEKLAISSPNGYELNSTLPKMGSMKPLGFVIPRIDFDNGLILEARKLNVDILEEFEFENIEDRGIFNTDVIIKKDNDRLVLKCKVVIGADGARSKLRRVLNIPYNSDNNTGIAIRYYCEMEGYNEMSLRLDFLKEINPGYGWLFPINKNYANIGVGIDVSKLKERNLNLDEMFESYLKYLNGKIKIKVIHESKMNYILPYGCEMPPLVNSVNKVLIGDAASMINPFTGEGIFYGMYAGKSLSDHIYNKLHNSKELTIGLKSFEKNFKRNFNKHYKINNTTKHLMGTVFSNLAIRACQKDPEILKEGIELMMGERRNFSPINLVKIIIKGLF